VSFVFPKYEPPKRQALLAPLWARPPTAQVPGLTAIRLEVAGSRGSVRIHSLEVYSSGFLTTVESRLPQKRLSAAELRSAERLHRESDHEGEVHDRVSVKIAFADRTAFLVEQARWAPHDPAALEPSGAEMILLDHSGGSSGDSVSFMGRRLWFTRLPPPGRVSIIVSWKGILAGSHRLSFEAESILDAAAGVVQAW
jgi:hypothetical protein